jgi:uncharacterized membrane protein
MLDYISWFSSAINDPILVSIILGAFPVSEVRGAVIYAFSISQPWLILPAIISNILVCPLILLLWKAINIPKLGSLILGKSLESKLLKLGKEYEKYGIIALILFIGIPLPATGVYTATLLGELLGIKRRNLLFASVIGVLLSAILTSIVVTRVFSLLS